MHRVLIIGCGRIAGGFDEGSNGARARTHAGAYRANGGFELVGCVEPDHARRAEFGEYWEIARAEQSTAGFAPGEVDVVSVASPTAAHVADVEAALRLGAKLIFCEKPVAPTAAETACLVEQCAASGVQLAVNYTRRWAPDVVALAGEIARGEWGAVRSVSGIYTKGVLHNGGHMVDLLHLLLGPLSLIAAGPPSFDFWDEDPSVPALLSTRDGVPVTLAIGNARDGALFELAILTERGEIAMRDGGLAWTVRRYGSSASFAGYDVLGLFEGRAGRYEEAMPAAVANIAATLETGAELASTGETALAAQRLCEQMRDAALQPKD